MRSQKPESKIKESVVRRKEGWEGEEGRRTRSRLEGEKGKIFEDVSLWKRTSSSCIIS